MIKEYLARIGSNTLEAKSIRDYANERKRSEAAGGRPAGSELPSPSRETTAEYLQRVHAQAGAAALHEAAQRHEMLDLSGWIQKSHADWDAFDAKHGLGAANRNSMIARKRADVEQQRARLDAEGPAPTQQERADRVISKDARYGVLVVARRVGAVAAAGAVAYALISEGTGTAHGDTPPAPAYNLAPVEQQYSPQDPSQLLVEIPPHHTQQ